jgi:hypothetical protein
MKLAAPSAVRAKNETAVHLALNIFESSNGALCPFKFHSPHADLQLVSVQFESAIALALPDECDVPHASTQDASVQPEAHARNASHSEPSPQSFRASPQLPATQLAQASTP